MTIFRQGPDGGREEHGDLVELGYGLTVSQTPEGQPRFDIETGDVMPMQVARVVLDGNGSALGNGVEEYHGFPNDSYIEEIRVEGDIAGSVTLDIRRAEFPADFPPVSADTIFPTGTTKPNLASNRKYQDVTLTGVDRNIDAGDEIAVVSSGASTVTKVTAEIFYSQRIGPFEPLEPDEVPDLVFWGEGDTENGSADGAAVAWTDISTVLNHMVQPGGVTGRKFTLRKNILNGHSVLESDGVDDMLETGAGLGAAPARTIISVMRRMGASVSGARYWSIWDHDFEAYEDSGQIKWRADAGINNHSFPTGASNTWAHYATRSRHQASTKIGRGHSELGPYTSYQSFLPLGDYKLSLGANDVGSHVGYNFGAAQFARVLVYNRRISNREWHGLVAGGMLRFGIPG